jgi:hypothetical protein
LKSHTTGSELSKLASLLKSLHGETKVVMECTGAYHLPIANTLHEAGLFVSAVHAQLIHNFGNNTIRKVKTDKADAIKSPIMLLLTGLTCRSTSPRKMSDICSRFTAANTPNTTNSKPCS